jgi:hypothetical protein
MRPMLDSVVSNKFVDIWIGEKLLELFSHFQNVQARFEVFAL